MLSGVHTAAVDAAGLPIEGFGSGNFLLDWDARNTLPAQPRDPLDNQPDVGKAAYSYARLSASADVSVDAQFRQVKDNDHPGQRVDADYKYRQTPGAGGSMEFVHAAPQNMTSKGATWAVKSRWTRTGAGRSDVKARGGDIPAGTEATANECWDGNYASRYASHQLVAAAATTAPRPPTACSRRRSTLACNIAVRRGGPGTPGPPHRRYRGETHE